ncbi:MAG: hypothetical protein ACAI44_16505 [Candidatus Sericytochromatia bacterium]
MAAKWEYGGEWKVRDLDEAVTARRFRLKTLANAGAPSLVTLQKV